MFEKVGLVWDDVIGCVQVIGIIQMLVQLVGQGEIVVIFEIVEFDIDLDCVFDMVLNIVLVVCVIQGDDIVVFGCQLGVSEGVGLVIKL